jgi:UDP-2,4-diacetamido-2,4,6-trideoxy-beta-L-altropyranose hydrolase
MLKNRNLIIRADASTQTGTGHIMRCIALAQAWQERGGHVIFLSHCKNDKLRHRIIHEGSHFEPIHKPYPDPSDLDQTIRKLSSTKKDRSSDVWLILDGYHFHPDYQKNIVESGHKLLVIDDYNHHPHYHAHILLNQNIHAPELKYSCNIDTVKLLGTKYILLRKEFLNYINWKRAIPEKANKVLVTLGGGDPDNVTLKVINALNRINESNLNVKVVIGPANPNVESLKKELVFSKFSYEILNFAKNMPELMTWANVAISAGGSTCWELCYFGVPFIVIILAKNQWDIGNGLDGVGAAKCLGWHEDISSANISQSLLDLLNNDTKLESMSRRSQDLLDGRGSKRIVNSILER